MQGRNEALDGLRGWLSVAVCIYHGILIPQGEAIYPIFFAPIGETTSIFRKMVLQVVNGDLAVTVFFVMSGAVLFRSLQIQGEGRAALPLSIDFIIRRVFRIYPGVHPGPAAVSGVLPARGVAVSLPRPHLFHRPATARQHDPASDHDAWRILVASGRDGGRPLPADRISALAPLVG